MCVACNGTLDLHPPLKYPEEVRSPWSVCLEWVQMIHNFVKYWNLQHSILHVSAGSFKIWWFNMPPHTHTHIYNYIYNYIYTVYIYLYIHHNLQDQPLLRMGPTTRHPTTLTNAFGLLAPWDCLSLSRGPDQEFGWYIVVLFMLFTIFTLYIWLLVYIISYFFVLLWYDISCRWTCISVWS